jgi:hypothetical protein
LDSTCNTPKMHIEAVLYHFIILAALLSLAGCKSRQITQQEADEIHRYALILEPIINIDKLDGLAGKRAATPRIRKACYWLEKARSEGLDPTNVITHAHNLTTPQVATRAQAQAESLLRNRTILERLGCLDENGMNKLRRGKAPTITKGPYAGELATVDHIIPRSVCPELDNRIYNLEFMPDTLNKRKSDKIGDRQRQLARKWYEAGLLSKRGLSRVMQRS